MDEKANQKIPASIGGTAAGDKATLKVMLAKGAGFGVQPVPAKAWQLLRL